MNDASCAGFTLIEVLVASAVVAITVAAATTAILTAQRAEQSALFYYRAALIAARLQAADLGIEPEILSESSIHGLALETEEFRADQERQTPAWKVYRMRSPETRQSLALALEQ